MHTIAYLRAQRHWRMMILTALALGAMGPWLPALDLERQFWIVLIPVALFGMSHGGADPLIITSLKTAHGRSTLLFLSGYVALMALAVAFILWQPSWALIGFLWLSVWHFASTDHEFMPDGASRLAGWLSGSLAIIGPMVGYPDQVATLFGWLLLREPASLLTVVSVAGKVLLTAWVIGMVIGYRRSPRTARGRMLVELSVLASAMILLPPLLAFAFYFCCVHSVRHFLLLMASAQDTQLAFGMQALARHAAPATLGALLLGLLVWLGMRYWQPGGDMAWLADGVTVVFWGLAVLTVPHSLMVAWWLRWQRA